MRTTLDLDDTLLTRAKTEAARRRTTLTRLIERGLARELDEADELPQPPQPFQWKITEGGVCLRPDIDWTSNASIYAALDEEYDMRQAGLLPFRDPDDPAE